MSGTAMPTPAVAGAAALWANARPDRAGAQLTDGLGSTTKPTGQSGPVSAGSGRPGVAPAVRSSVFATGSAFAAVKWPCPWDGVVQKDGTYTNAGADPVTLDVAVKAQGIPAGL